MIKKLFHLADLHFRTYKRIEESKEACQKFIDEVSQYIDENKLEHNECRVVIAGDIVHQKITKKFIPHPHLPHHGEHKESK